MSLKANISNISRGSLHDGEGVRTVVYFKGCGLRCLWCHNPETLKRKKEIIFNKSRCICCGECIKVCPEQHRIIENQVEILRDGCKGCGRCVQECPAGAISLCGEEMTVDEVMTEIMKDVHYYNESKGGVTLSGGECLLQADFARDLLKKCKKRGINTAIESAMFVPYENVEKVLPYLDLAYIDLKIPEPEKHEKYTGRRNEIIIENIQRLSKEFDNVVIRIPLIPGVNDSTEDMKKFAEIISTFGEGIKDIELLKYNYLAETKYAAVGMKYNEFGKKTHSDEKIKILYGALNAK